MNSKSHCAGGLIWLAGLKDTMSSHQRARGGAAGAVQWAVRACARLQGIDDKPRSRTDGGCNLSFFVCLVCLLVFFCSLYACPSCTSDSLIVSVFDIHFIGIFSCLPFLSICLSLFFFFVCLFSWLPLLLVKLIANNNKYKMGSDCEPASRVITQIRIHGDRYTGADVRGGGHALPSLADVCALTGTKMKEAKV